jgi:hypothetical protein
MPSKNRRLALVLAGAAALVASAAPQAQAGVLVSSATDCAAQTLSQPFLPWADPAQYVLAPGGDAESGNGWTLTGGAAPALGNEPWKVTAATDSASLNLPAGSTATTGVMCVGIEHPTLRFFASSTTPLDALTVEVLFEDATGTVQDLTIGRMTNNSWTPTPVMPVVVNLLALLPGEKTAVAFRFTPEGTGSWRIDDVYVDPYGRY